jgi:hypothetical protein
VYDVGGCGLKPARRRAGSGTEDLLEEGEHRKLPMWTPRARSFEVREKSRRENLVPTASETNRTEVFRRKVLAAFVKEGLFSPETAGSMPAWPHSGFHIHHRVSESGDEKGRAQRSVGQGC